MGIGTVTAESTSYQSQKSSNIDCRFRFILDAMASSSILFLFLVCVPFNGRFGVLCSLSTATQCQTTTLPLLGANFSDCYFMWIELKLIHCVILPKIKTRFVRECVQNVWKSQFHVIFSTCRA